MTSKIPAHFQTDAERVAWACPDVSKRLVNSWIAGSRRPLRKASDRLSQDSSASNKLRFEKRFAFFVQTSPVSLSLTPREILSVPNSTQVKRLELQGSPVLLAGNRRSHVDGIWSNVFKVDTGAPPETAVGGGVNGPACKVTATAIT
jgi:hypothetical protein